MGYGRELSSAEIRLGEVLQALEEVPGVRALYNGARWAIAGSNSSSAISASWLTVSTVRGVGGDPTWHEGQPNPDSRSWLPRTWKKAIVLGIGEAAMGEIIDDIPMPHEALPAVAYCYKDRVHVGILPFFGVLAGTKSNSCIYSAAMRESRRPIRGTVGLYHNGILYVHNKTEVVADGVNTAHLAEFYSGLPYTPSTPLAI